MIIFVLQLQANRSILKMFNRTRIFSFLGTPHFSTSLKYFLDVDRLIRKNLFARTKQAKNMSLDGRNFKVRFKHCIFVPACASSTRVTYRINFTWNKRKIDNVARNVRS